MANGTAPSGENFRGSLLRHISALLIIGALLVWLFFGLLHPDTNYLTENAEGIIVGGFVSIITLVVNSLFQSEATKQAARSAQTAHDQGAAAALTVPPAPAGDAASYEAMKAGAGVQSYQTFVCQVDGLGFMSQEELAKHMQTHQ